MDCWFALAFSDIMAPKAENPKVRQRVIGRLPASLRLGYRLDVIALPPRLTHRTITTAHEASDRDPHVVGQHLPKTLPDGMEGLHVNPALLARRAVPVSHKASGDVPVGDGAVQAGAFPPAEEPTTLLCDFGLADTTNTRRLIRVHRARVRHSSTHKRHNGAGNYSAPSCRNCWARQRLSRTERAACAETHAAQPRLKQASTSSTRRCPDRDLIETNRSDPKDAAGDVSHRCRITLKRLEPVLRCVLRRYEHPATETTVSCALESDRRAHSP